MISREDVQRLIHRRDGDQPVLSVFLDMAVNAEGRRNHRVFLDRRRREFSVLDSDRANHHREAIGEAFARVDGWLADHYEEANKGVVVYTEVGGDWFEARQFPVPVPDRIEIAERPIVGPLAEIVERYHHHGVVLVDREHLRMLSMYLGQPLEEHEVRGDPYPAPHDVRRGGYSAADYQRRKAEEVRHFYREFAQEVTEFDRRYAPDDLILLGTDENVQGFKSFLPKHVRDKVVHTAHADVDAAAPAVAARLEPYFRAQLEREADAAVGLLRARVSQRHLAAAGFEDTLEQLQEGKVDTLVVSQGVRHAGARCTRCRFYLEGDSHGACPYCGGDVRTGVDLVEAMICMAEEQDVPIEFTDPQALEDLEGVGALLKF